MAIYLSNDDVNELLTMKACMKSIGGRQQKVRLCDQIEIRHGILGRMGRR